MAHYLLIHGGSHGAWCWKAVTSQLEAAGHRAFALDLPGHGLDTTPRKNVSVAAYAHAVNKAIQSESPEHLIVVGHSLAGIILPQIAVDNPGLVKQLVFLAALVLAPGEAAIDLIPEQRRPSYYEAAAKSSDGGSFKVDFDTARRMFFNDLPEDAARAAFSMLTPQPFGVYIERARQDVRQVGSISRYIFCTNDCCLPRALTDSCARKLAVTPEPIESGHDIMLANPDALCALLLQGAPHVSS